MLSTFSVIKQFLEKSQHLNNYFFLPAISNIFISNRDIIESIINSHHKNMKRK